MSLRTPDELSPIPKEIAERVVAQWQTKQPDGTDAMEKFREMGDVSKIFTQTDRNCAVVGAVLIEEELSQLLLSRFSNVNKEVRRMFHPDHVLAGLGPKITLSYALGIIDVDVYSDLHLIRKIRNHFAHAPLFHPETNDSPPTALTFQHKVIERLTSAMKYPAILSQFPEVKSGEAKIATGSRARFEYTCKWLYQIFWVNRTITKYTTPISYNIY